MRVFRAERGMHMVAVIVLMLLAATSACALTLVDAGKTEYVIVVGADAIPAERFAAEELALHLEQMSGVKLPLATDADALPGRAILLGRTRYTAGLGVKIDGKRLGQEGYLLRVSGDYLIIVGGRPRGTLYGVYALLEDHLGCRWFAPDTTVIPRRKTIELPPLNMAGRPAFEYRDPKLYAGGPRSAWWRRHFDSRYVARTRNSGTFVHAHVHPMDERYGGHFKIIRFGHNLSALVPAKLYATDHPEYFAWHGGRRMMEGDLELCLTHPDVARIAADTLRTWMRAEPDADMLFIGQSDTNKYCMCDRCMSAYLRFGPVKPDRKHGSSFGLGYGGLAGRNLQFVNRVAKLLEDEFPNQRIGIFAYGATRNPASKNIEKAHRNVVVWYCPIERCMCHPIDSGPINAGSYAFTDGIRKWQQLAREVYLYDYCFGPGFELPTDVLSIAGTVRAAQRLGVKGVMVDTIGNLPGGFGFLQCWLRSQLLRNPDFDADAGLREFLNAYYGAAGPRIGDFIRLVSDPTNYEPLPAEQANIWTAPDSPKRRKLVYGCHLRRRKLVRHAIDKGHALFQKALQATAADAKARLHVEAAKIVLQVVMLEELPADDPRLKDEATRLLSVASQLEMPFVRRTPVQEYREQISRRLGLEIPE